MKYCLGARTHAILLVAFLAIVAPIGAHGQADFPLYCDLLDDADCTFLLASQSAMSSLHAGASQTDVQFVASGIPDAPFDTLTVTISQATSFNLTEEANQQRLALQSLLQNEADATVDLLFNAYATMLLGASFDSELNLSLSEDVVELIQRAAEEEGDPIPFELPATITLRTRMTDGAIYINISDLAAVLPGLQSRGDIWFGVEFRSLLAFALEEALDIDELQLIDPAQIAQASPLLTASSIATAGPLATMLASMPGGNEVAPFLLVERLQDEELDGRAAATFRTTVDYTALLEDRRIQDLLTDLMFEQGIVGPNATAQEIDDMLFLASSFGPQLFDTLGLRATEKIDLESGLLLHAQLQFDWDVAQIAPLLEMAGDDALSTLDELPVLSLAVRTSYREHNSAPAPPAPDTALILSTAELMQIIETALEAERAQPQSMPAIVAGELTPVQEDPEELYLRAVALINDDEYAMALTLLDDAIAQDGQNAAYLTERGRAYFFLDQFAPALADFESAIALEPSAVNLNGRGAALRQLGDLEAAIVDFEAAIELDPRYPQAYYNLGLAHARMGAYALAVESYSEALAIDPAYVEAVKERGVAYYEIGEYEQALEDLNAAIEQAPAYAAAYIDRGNVYLVYEEFAQAEENYTSAIELNPASAIARNNRGWLYYLQERDEEALEDYRIALELDPLYLTVYYNRGDLYRLLAEYELAILDYDRILEIDPSSGWAYYDRGLSYYDLGDFERAAQDLDAYIAFDPEEASAYFYRGYAHFMLGENEKELADYSAAIELDPEYALAYYYRALNLIRQEAYAPALDDLNAALRLKPEDIDYLNERGLLYLDVGAIALGIADFSRIIELAPEDPLGYLNRGFAHYLNQEYESALADATMAVELNPEDPIAWGNRADANGLVGNIEEALTDFDKTLELDPEYAIAYLDRGKLHERLQQFPEAIADFERYLELAPDAEDRAEIEAKIEALQ